MEKKLSEPTKEELMARITELEKQVELLDALEAGGVDNWDGYDFALEDAGI